MIPRRRGRLRKRVGTGRSWRLGRKGLLLRSTRPGPKDAGGRNTERHGPRLHHAGPWVEPGLPLRHGRRRRASERGAIAAVAAGAAGGGGRGWGRRWAGSGRPAFLPLLVGRSTGRGARSGGRRRGTPSVEGLSTGAELLLELLETFLLEKKLGAHLAEGGKRILAIDGGDHVAKFGVEAAEQIHHLIVLTDRMPNVGELPGQHLQLGAVLSHGEITLHEGTELRFEVDDAGEAIVVEQFLNHRPDSDGSVVLLHDDVEEVGGDGGVEPVDDALVDHGPLRIGEAGRGGVLTWSRRPNFTKAVSKRRRHWE